MGRQDDHEATIESKEHGVIDWYAEGPGRRVGYDDFTAIDWIYEYAKERQRLRMLYSSASGVLGCLRQFIDASQIWLVLVGTGLMTGAIAALIDIASDWLGDLKTGVCVAGEGGGRFYLNHGFCCWGLDGTEPDALFQHIRLIRIRNISMRRLAYLGSSLAYRLQQRLLDYGLRGIHMPLCTYC